MDTFDLKIKFGLADHGWLECSVTYPADVINRQPIIVHYGSLGDNPDYVADLAASDIAVYMRDPKKWLVEYIETISTKNGHKIQEAKREIVALSKSIEQAQRSLDSDKKDLRYWQERLTQLE